MLTDGVSGRHISATKLNVDSSRSHMILQILVEPSPATHAILTVLKAGESVFQIRLRTKQWFMDV